MSGKGKQGRLIDIRERRDLSYALFAMTLLHTLLAYRAHPFCAPHHLGPAFPSPLAAFSTSSYLCSRHTCLETVIERRQIR